VNASQIFNNVNGSAFNSDENAKKTVETAIADVITDIEPEDVKVIRIRDVKKRRLLLQGNSESIIIDYTIAYTVTGGATEAMAKFESIKNELSAAVANDTFSKILQQRASNFSAFSLLISTSDTILEIENPVIVLTTRPPTSSPSAAPTIEKISSTTIKVFEILVIGIVVLFVVSTCVIYYYYADFADGKKKILFFPDIYRGSKEDAAGNNPSIGDEEDFTWKAPLEPDVDRPTTLGDLVRCSNPLPYQSHTKQSDRSDFEEKESESKQNNDVHSAGDDVGFIIGFSAGDEMDDEYEDDTDEGEA
jgi:hypothetical protein